MVKERERAEISNLDNWLDGGRNTGKGAGVDRIGCTATSGGDVQWVVRYGCFESSRRSLV